MAAPAFVTGYSGFAAATGTTLATATITASVGDFLVVAVAADNASATTPTITIADSAGNTWTSATQNNGAASATAGAGIVQRLFYCRVTNALASGTITATFSVTVTNRVMRIDRFTGVAAAVSATLVSGGTTTASTTVSQASGSIPVGDLCYAVAAIEYGTLPTLTYDSDTLNGTWATGVTVTSGTGATGTSLARQYKIQTTAASAQTWNLTHTSARRSWSILGFAHSDATVTAALVAAPGAGVPAPTVTAGATVVPGRLATSASTFANSDVGGWTSRGNAVLTHSTYEDETDDGHSMQINSVAAIGVTIDVGASATLKIPVVPGETVPGSFEFSTTGTSRSFNFYWDFVTEAGVSVGTPPYYAFSGTVTSTWTSIPLSGVTVPVGAAYAEGTLYIGTSGAGQLFYIDDFQVPGPVGAVARVPAPAPSAGVTIAAATVAAPGATVPTAAIPVYAAVVAAPGAWVGAPKPGPGPARVAAPGAAVPAPTVQLGSNIDLTAPASPTFRTGFGSPNAYTGSITLTGIVAGDLLIGMYDSDGNNVYPFTGAWTGIGSGVFYKYATSGDVGAVISYDGDISGGMAIAAYYNVPAGGADGTPALASGTATIPAITTALANSVETLILYETTGAPRTSAGYTSDYAYNTGYAGMQFLTKPLGAAGVQATGTLSSSVDGIVVLAMRGGSSSGLNIKVVAVSAVPAPAVSASALIQPAVVAAPGASVKTVTTSTGMTVAAARVIAPGAAVPATTTAAGCTITAIPVTPPNGTVVYAVVVTHDMHQNLTPAVITGLAGQPSPTEAAGSTLSAAMVVAPGAAVPSPAPGAGCGVTPACVVAPGTALPPPTPSAGQSAAASLVAAPGAAVPGISSINTGAGVLAVRVIAPGAAVLAPTPSSGVTLAAAVVVALANQPSPTEAAGAGIVAATVAGLASVPGPFVYVGSTLAPSTCAPGAPTVYVPALSTGSTSTPVTVLGVAAVPSTAPFVGSVLTPSVVMAPGVALPTDFLSTGMTVTALTVAPPAATVIRPGLPAALTAALVVAPGASVPAPTLTYPATVTAVLVAAPGAAVWPLSVSSGETVAPAVPAYGFATVPAPSVSIGQTLTPAPVAAVVAVLTATPGAGVGIAPLSVAAVSAFLPFDMALAPFRIVTPGVSVPSPGISTSVTLGALTVAAPGASVPAPSAAAHVSITAALIVAPGAAVPAAGASASAGIAALTVAAPGAAVLRPSFHVAITAALVATPGVSVPSPSLAYGQTVTATTLAAPGASVPVAVAGGGAGIIAARVAAPGATQPAPGLSVGSTLAAVMVFTFASQPSPTEAAGSLIGVGLVVGALASVPTPSITTGATVIPVAVTAPGVGVPSATVSASSTVLAAVVTGVTAVPLASVVATLGVSPSTVAAPGASVPAPSLSTGVLLAPATVVGVAAAPAPATSSGASFIQWTTIAAIANQPSPAEAAGATIAAATVRAYSGMLSGPHLPGMGTGEYIWLPNWAYFTTPKVSQAQKSDWRVWYEVYSVDLSTYAPFQPDGGELGASNYYGADQTTAVTNIAGYTTNGNAQRLALRTWAAKDWQYSGGGGPNVYWITWKFVNNPTYGGFSGQAWRNLYAAPSLLVGDRVAIPLSSITQFYDGAIYVPGAHDIAIGTTIAPATVAAVVAVPSEAPYVGSILTPACVVAPGAALYTVNVGSEENALPATVLAVATIPSPIVRAHASIAATRVLAGVRVQSLISYNTASIETDATGFPTVQVNATVARDTTEHLDGVASLKVTSAGAGSVYAQTITGAGFYPVVPGGVYTSLISAKSTLARTFYSRIFWFTAAFIPTQTGNAIGTGVVASTSWQQASCTAVAPPDAAHCIIGGMYSNALGAGEVIFYDQLDLHSGFGTQWAWPSLRGIPSPALSASSNVLAVRVAAVVSVPAPTIANGTTITSALVAAPGAAVLTPSPSASILLFASAVVAPGAALPAVVVRQDRLVLPATVVAVASVYAPTPSAGSRALPLPVVGLGTVPAPGVSASENIHPATVAAYASSDAVSIVAGWSVAMNPDCVTALAALGTVSLSTGVTLSPSPVLGTVAVLAPTPHAGQTASAQSVDAAVRMTMNEVSAGSRGTPEDVVSTSTVNGTSTSAGSCALATSISATGEITSTWALSTSSTLDVSTQRFLAFVPEAYASAGSTLDAPQIWLYADVGPPLVRALSPEGWGYFI